MRIYQRHEWGARYPDGFRDRALPCSEVWLHHTVMGDPDTASAERAEMRRIESVGQSRFGGGISYTFLVFPSGRVYEGHSVWRSGSHTKGRNDFASAICLPGNYEQRGMTAAQVLAVANLLDYGHRQGWWENPRLNGGHRDLKSTACPGIYAYNQIPHINHLARTSEGTKEGVTVSHEILKPGRNRSTTLGVEEKGLQVCLGLGFIRAQIHHIKAFDGAGNQLEYWGPMKVGKGNPRWDREIPGGAIALEIYYTHNARGASKHDLSAWTRKVY